MLPRACLPDAILPTREDECRESGASVFNANAVKAVSDAACLLWYSWSSGAPIACRCRACLRAPAHRVTPTCRRSSGHAVFALMIWWAAGGSMVHRLHAAESALPLVLSADQREAIARAFAPTLVLHPLEEYLPISSMFPLGADTAPEAWPTRVVEYRALSLAEKLEPARRWDTACFHASSAVGAKSSSNTGVTTCTTRSPSAVAGCLTVSVTTTRTISNASILS